MYPQEIQQNLNFDAWYGTQTVNDSTVGVFGSQGGTWRLDNGNGRIDPCGTQQTTTTDQCPSFGLAGDRPVTGKWNPTASGKQIGVFRAPTPGAQAWYYLDYNDNRLFDGCSIDRCYAFGLGGDYPIAGDWNGDGKTEIGVFRPGALGAQAWFYPDYNGNGQFDGCSIDRCYYFGLGGDLPVVGDWNNDGKAEVGIYRIQSGNGTFYFDYNGNGLWDAGDVPYTFGLGTAGDRPVAGDWTGTGGAAKVGIYRPSTGQWYLDNGDRIQQGCSGDQCFVTAFSGAADWPIAWNKSEVKAN